MADTFTVVKGIRYPTAKKMRDKIRDGKKTSAKVAPKDWTRVSAGSEGVTIPADLVPEFKRRNAIKKEK